jgi:anti-sigma regulatory factor (Ser/Thr protein kinase)
MVVSSRTRMVFAVPIDRSQCGVVRKTVRELLETAGFLGDVAEDVLLALGEAFANAVAHGSGTRFEQVGISTSAHRRHVAMELRYPGEPFDTRPPAEPSLDQLTGRGRYLMAMLMDSVTYTFPPGETIVRLEKTIRGALECQRYYYRLAIRSPPQAVLDDLTSAAIRRSRGGGIHRLQAAGFSFSGAGTTIRPNLIQHF